MKRCSLIGPISHLPDGNREAFAAAKRVLVAEGWQCYNPRAHPLSDACAAEAQLLGDAFRTGPLYQKLMRHCFAKLVIANTAFVLPQWYMSSGAKREVLVAQTMGMEVLNWDPNPDRRTPVLHATDVGLVPVLRVA